MALSKETQDMADDLMRQLKEQQDENKKHEPAYLVLARLAALDRDFPAGKSTGRRMEELNELIAEAGKVMKHRVTGIVS